MYKVTPCLLLGLLALTCGFPTDQETLKSRIVGGSDASPGEFPYMASIRRAGNHHCGGSIITPQTVLTAAHCIAGRPASDMRVVVGTIHLNSGGDTYQLLRTVPHASYHPMASIYNDVGVVITTTNIITGPTVAIIPIATDAIDAGVSATLTGWGFEAEGGTVTNVLQKLSTRTITLQQCKAATGLALYSGNMCTVSKSGEGACRGDSGSPLVVDGKQYGVFAWVRLCGDGEPDGFTDAVYYLPWIIQNTVQ